MRRVVVGSVIFATAMLVSGIWRSTETAGDAALSLEDEQAVRNLIAQYSQAYDDRDIDSWLATFLDDARVQGYRGGQRANESLSNGQRRAGVIKRFAEFEENGVQMRHYSANYLYRLQSDGAIVGTTTFLVTEYRSGEPAPIFRTGVWRDRIVRTAEGLKFVEREIHIDQR